MVEETKTSLTYAMEKEKKIFIMVTERTLRLKKGDIVEFNKAELEEIKRQPRSELYFKELKTKPKSTKPGGGVNG